MTVLCVTRQDTDVNDGVMDRLWSVPPRSTDPQLRERIISTAARLLAVEGAVSARLLARELGTSTMVVYTHFGGMDELTRQVMRRGFDGFGAELDRSACLLYTSPSPRDS